LGVGLGDEGGGRFAASGGTAGGDVLFDEFGELTAD